MHINIRGHVWFITEVDGHIVARHNNLIVRSTKPTSYRAMDEVLDGARLYAFLWS